MANKNEKTIRLETETKVPKESSSAPEETKEETQGEAQEFAIDPERAKRILAADRLSIDRGVLEGFVQFVYEYMMSISDPLKTFNDNIMEANNGSKNKRKLSVNLKEFSNFINDSIRFMFRMQGTITAVQQDIDAEGFNEKTKEDETINMGK